MQCRDVRELLDSYVGQELLVETNHEVLRHLSGCPECRADLDARSRLRSNLRRAVTNAAELQMRPEFAAELADRLRGAPVASESQTWRPSGWLALAASLTLVAAAAILYSYLGTRPAQIARQAAGDHRNCAVSFHLPERPISLADAARQYDPAYERLQNTPPDVVPTDAGELRVVDRHSCVFDGQRFGHVVLRLDTHLVSVLMTKDDGLRASTAPEGELAWLPAVDGLSMASVRRPGHVVYIVSDLSETPFRQVAQSLANPVSRIAELLGNISTPPGD